MRTIGILTLNGFFNYGNRVQNYALQIVLEKLNFKVDTIWWDESKKLVADKNLFNFKSLRRYVLNKHGFRESGTRDFLADGIKEYNIKKFSEKYIHTQYEYKIASDLNERYDHFVVGSDQVWNPYWVNSEIMYLMFAKPEKRIAYAASYGIAEIPEKYRKEVKHALEGMHAISVREEAGAEIVRTLTGKDVPVLIDPTALLTKEEWYSIAEKPFYIKDERYILTYFLGEVPKNIQREIDNIAQTNGFSVIHLMDKSNLDHYCTSPQEFIWLIKNCEIMYTDSFHGTIFSIIMNKPFIVTSKKTRNKKMNMDSRIDTILSTFKLSDRKVSTECNLCSENVFDISFKDTAAIMERERTRSIEYLKNALSVR